MHFSEVFIPHFYNKQSECHFFDGSCIFFCILQTIIFFLRYAKNYLRSGFTFSSEKICISLLFIQLSFERFESRYLAALLAQTLPISETMNFFDAFIIYLACGAPFGVYYFVNHRNRQNRSYFKTILISIFWFPFAFGLFQKYVTKKLPDSFLSKKEKLRDEEIIKTKKDLEQILLKDNNGVSIFEIREIIERYIGLTDAVENQDDSGATDSRFFEIAGNKNVLLSNKCYQRRNRKLLSFHQTLAGQDFLELISGFVSRFSVTREIEKTSLILVELLNDEKTKKGLKSIFNGRPQRLEKVHVQKSEKELWINDRQQPQPANALQISMNAAGARINSPIKD